MLGSAEWGSRLFFLWLSLRLCCCIVLISMSNIADCLAMICATAPDGLRMVSQLSSCCLETSWKLGILDGWHCLSSHLLDVSCTMREYSCQAGCPSAWPFIAIAASRQVSAIAFVT